MGIIQQKAGRRSFPVPRRAMLQAAVPPAGYLALLPSERGVQM